VQSLLTTQYNSFSTKLAYVALLVITADLVSGKLINSFFFSGPESYSIEDENFKFKNSGLKSVFMCPYSNFISFTLH